MESVPDEKHGVMTFKLHFDEGLYSGSGNFWCYKLKQKLSEVMGKSGTNGHRRLLRCACSAVNVSLTSLQALNAILYLAEQGYKWRGLPKRFGGWHTIYTRMNRWAKSGVLVRLRL